MNPEQMTDAELGEHCADFAVPLPEGAPKRAVTAYHARLGTHALAMGHECPKLGEAPLAFVSAFHVHHGFAARFQGVPLEEMEALSEFAAAGWHTCDGGEAYKAGLPLDPAKPEPWQTGYRLAAAATMAHGKGQSRH